MNGLIRRGTVAMALAVAVLAGCKSEPSLGPDQQLVGAPANAIAGGRTTPDLGSCDSLQAPEGSQLAFRVYATGSQIYRWTGSSWTFVAPAADLFADADGNGKVGTHYAGPTWESTSGSKVIGTVMRRCTPNPTAIPWLLLSGVSSGGAGIFNGVTFIQRVNTAGGIAPAQPGSTIGEMSNVPYTTEYYFYR